MQKFCIRAHKCFVEVRTNFTEFVSKTGRSHMETTWDQQLSHLESRITDLHVLISPPGFAGFGPPINTVNAHPMLSASVFNKVERCWGHSSIALEKSCYCWWLWRDGKTYSRYSLALRVALDFSCLSAIMPAIFACTAFLVSSLASSQTSLATFAQSPTQFLFVHIVPAAFIAISTRQSISLLPNISENTSACWGILSFANNFVAFQDTLIGRARRV